MKKKTKKKYSKFVRKLLIILFILIHSRVLRIGILIGGIARIMYLCLAGLITATSLNIFLICGGVWFIWDLFASGAEDTGDYLFKPLDEEDDDVFDIYNIQQEYQKKLEKEKKETKPQERVTTYASYVEKKEALKKENNEMISDIERNIDSDFGRIKSRKNEYISLLELVEKYKELERKQNIESSDNDSLDDIGYAYMKR